MIETVGAMRLSSLTTGTICRIGIALSTCFWIPAALLMGIAGAMGLLPDPDLGFAPAASPVLPEAFCKGSAARSSMIWSWCWARSASPCCAARWAPPIRC